MNTHEGTIHNSSFPSPRVVRVHVQERTHRVEQIFALPSQGPEVHEGFGRLLDLAMEHHGPWDPAPLTIEDSSP